MTRAKPIPTTPIAGHCIRVGTDEEGMPRIVIKLTRHELAEVGQHWLYHDVTVRLADPQPMTASPATETKP